MSDVDDRYRELGIKLADLARTDPRRFAQVLEPVVAAAGPPRGTAATQIERMAAANRATASPNRARSGGSGPSSAVVTAAAAGGNVVAGQTITSSTELSALMSETLRRMQADPVHFGRKHTIASARWSYPEERQLGDSIEANTKKIDAVCGLSAPRYDKRSGALVASGGICLPTNVDYDVPTWVSTERPLRDGLPQFQATRGGIQFVTPPDIGVPPSAGTASGSGLATGTWTEGTDAAPGGATKNIWTVACGSPVTVLVDAVTTRVQFGNMMSRFAPEQLSSNTEQALAATARQAELNLLSKMYAASNQILAAQYLGAVRDLLASVDVIRAQYIYSHRYSPNVSLTAVFPAWVKDVLRADLARETAHDNAGAVDALAVTDGQIDDWFSARGINVIWTLDALPAATYGTGGHALPTQAFPKLTAGGNAEWPGGGTQTAAFTLGWLLFVTGTFQFLDGGRLDLGVVRDSLLDATNDFETFSETFESIAFRGNEVYQVQSVLLPNGASSGGTVGTVSYHE